jgi:hypothetical protein
LGEISETRCRNLVKRAKVIGRPTAISTSAEKMDRKALGPTRDGAIKLWSNDASSKAW